jgi:DNA mismatch repair protein MutS
VAGEVIFLRNLVEGASSHSYGIHVARLAGLPSAVIERAKEILQNLESGEAGKASRHREERADLAEPADGAVRSTGKKISAELRKLDVSHLSPIEALNLLYQWSEEAKK